MPAGGDAGARWITAGGAPPRGGTRGGLRVSGSQQCVAAGRGPAGRHAPSQLSIGHFGPMSAATAEGPMPALAWRRRTPFRVVLFILVLSLFVQFGASGASAVTNRTKVAVPPAPDQLAKVFAQSRSFWSSVLPAGEGLIADLPSRAPPASRSLEPGRFGVCVHPSSGRVARSVSRDQRDRHHGGGPAWKAARSDPGTFDHDRRRCRGLGLAADESGDGVEARDRACGGPRAHHRWVDGGDAVARNGAQRCLGGRSGRASRGQCLDGTGITAVRRDGPWR